MCYWLDCLTGRTRSEQNARNDSARRFESPPPLTFPVPSVSIATEVLRKPLAFCEYVFVVEVEPLDSVGKLISDVANDVEIGLKLGRI